MRDNRLQLVEPENSAKESTDSPTERLAVTAMPDAVVQRLRLVDAGEGTPPDDAA
jgi:hypothetical protein